MALLAAAYKASKWPLITIIDAIKACVAKYTALVTYFFQKLLSTLSSAVSSNVVKVSTNQAYYLWILIVSIIIKILLSLKLVCILSFFMAILRYVSKFSAAVA